MPLVHLTATNKIDGGSLLLPIDINAGDIPPKIMEYALTNDFEIKDEFHVTIIGKRWTPLIHDGIQAQVDRLVDQVDWHINLTDKYYVLRKDDQNGEQKFSIVRLLDLPELSNFVSQFSTLIGHTLEDLQPHVTIFTKGSKDGIGIYSKSEFESYVFKELN